MANITTSHLTEYEPQPGRGPSSGTITQTGKAIFNVYPQGAGTVTDTKTKKDKLFNVTIK